MTVGAMSSAREAAPLGLDAALEHIVKERRSCRAFGPTPLEQAVLERLFSLALQTPSWCNTQPWQVSVVGGAARTSLSTDLISAFDSGVRPNPDFAFPAGYPDAYGERRRASGYLLYDAIGVERSDKTRHRLEIRKNFEFFGAPHVAFITSPLELGLYGAVDCGLLVANVLNAAESLAVGAIAQASLALYPDIIRSRLGLSDGRRVICGIALGRAHVDHAVNGFRTSRVDLSEAVSFQDDLPPVASTPSITRHS